MVIHKKSSGSVLPINCDEEALSVPVPVPVPGNRQQENKSPAIHTCTDGISNLEDQRVPMKGSSIDKIPLFSTLWFRKQRKDIFHSPKGVQPNHRFAVTWLGRIGFISKGVVYAVMGGLCIATAQHLKGDITGTESPMVCINFICIIKELSLYLM